MKINLTGVAFVLVACFVFTEAWKGNVCTRRRSRTVRRRVCGYQTWAGCCWYVWRSVCEYYTERYCCTGWRHNGDQNCNIAICRPPCENRGDCVRPNQCSCLPAYSGPTCEGVLCSHLKPCYPGYCKPVARCFCDNGFGGDQCKTITGTEEIPNILRSTCMFRYYHRMKEMDIYQYTTDATGLDDTDIVWVNQDGFNEVTFMMESIYRPPEDMSLLPNYVSESALGIVKGEVEVVHTKISINDVTQRTEALNETYECDVSNGSDGNPNTDVYNCTIKKEYTHSWESGDWLTATFRTKNGGKRRLRNINNNQLLPEEYYIGKETTKTVQFKFDFAPPVHCSDEGSCSHGEEILLVTQDITRETIQTSFGGWKDDDAGMRRYAWEIFKLKPDENGLLYEPHVPNNLPLPITNIGINHTDGEIYYNEYTLTEAGMYSIVLEASDSGNNSVYARRMVLYDATSSITFSTEHAIRIETSYEYMESEKYYWQTLESNTETTIRVAWNNYFLNKVHEDGKLLNGVRSFPKIQLDPEMRGTKEILEKYDDNEGRRTIKPISNSRGITEFAVVYTDGNVNGTPTSGWTSVGLEHKYEFSKLVQEGDPLKIWVKAEDIVGNEKIDWVIINFDNSQPLIQENKLNFDQYPKQQRYEFQSNLDFDAYDKESGVKKVEYNLTVDGGRFLYQKVFFVKELTSDESKNNPREYYCTRSDSGCYPYGHTIELDHCKMTLSKEEQTVTMHVDIFNGAGLRATFTHKILDVHGMKGLAYYPGPSAVNVTGITDKSAIVRWDQNSSCYTKTGIKLIVRSPSGQLGPYTLHQDATSHDLYGLEEETAYYVDVYIEYEDKDSDSVTISFTTGETDGLSGGAIGGIVVGFLLLILIIVLLIILWRTGRLACCSKDVEAAERPKSFLPRSLTVKAIKAKFTKDQQGFTNHGYGDRSTCVLEEDDYYGYREDLFNENPSWLLSRADITFESLVASGRFANIYKATSHHGTKRQETVVAKTVKEQHSDDDIKLMKSKIQFYADEVGNHPNILQFIGAVGDDSTVGPFMVLEFCENGTLHDYLQKNRHNVTTDLQDKLYRFSFDTAKGMEYLASRKITHRRLAARNILLTYICEVKISGFGPKIPETEGDDKNEASKKERIPIKWMSPEFIEDHRACNEKSDVWSYGIVLWEIFSLGETPFKGIRSGDLVNRLKKGYRLEKPEQCDQEHYKLMKKCWHEKQNSRPTFKAIHNELEPMFVTSGGDDYYYDRS